MMLPRTWRCQFRPAGRADGGQQTNVEVQPEQSQQQITDANLAKQMQAMQRAHEEQMAAQVKAMQQVQLQMHI